MNALHTPFKMRHVLFLLSASTLIITGCASTSLDTAYVKNGDEAIAIKEVTVQEENMTVLTIEDKPTVTTNEEAIVSTDDEAPSETAIMVSGNQDAYVEITPPLDDPNNEILIEGGNSLKSLVPPENIGLTITDTDRMQQVSDALDGALSPEPSHHIVLFNTNSAKVEIEDRSMLVEHAQYLQNTPNASLIITGHADNRGTAQYNQRLSEERAKSIAKLLIEMGVDETQLAVQGLGASHPIADVTNWAANRRVELNYKNPTILTSR